MQRNHQAGNSAVLLNQYQSAPVSPSLEWLAYSRMMSAQLYNKNLADDNQPTTKTKHGVKSHDKKNAPM